MASQVASYAATYPTLQDDEVSVTDGNPQASIKPTAQEVSFRVRKRTRWSSHLITIMLYTYTVFVLVLLLPRQPISLSSICSLIYSYRPS